MPRRRSTELVRIHEELLQRSELLDVLYSFAPRVETSLELAEVLQATTATIQTLLGGAWCALLPTKKTSANLIGLAGTPLKDTVAQLQAGELPVPAPRETSEPHFVSLPGHEPVLVVPMELRSSLLGWILVGYPAGTHQVAERTLQLGTEIARQAAVALENVQLVRQLKEQQEALRQSEEALEQRAAQLAAVNKELEAFSYSVSHDLRAPLRSIDGFSQALFEDYADRLDPQAQDYLRRVRSNTQRMGELIDDLLSLSRVTRADMHREPVNLSTLAHSIASTLHQTQPHRQVTWSIADGLSATGDSRLLRIVLENLLSNAWKYTSKHPSAHIEFGATTKEGITTFFVKDDGAGFDMAYADRLFGAFQRLHPASEFEGTGVGLATVQRIINRHGGRIWAEGAVEQGATFFFTLSS